MRKRNSTLTWTGESRKTKQVRNKHQFTRLGLKPAGDMLFWLIIEPPWEAKLYQLLKQNKQKSETTTKTAPRAHQNKLSTLKSITWEMSKME